MKRRKINWWAVGLVVFVLVLIPTRYIKYYSPYRYTLTQKMSFSTPSNGGTRLLFDFYYQNGFHSGRTGAALRPKDFSMDRRYLVKFPIWFPSIHNEIIFTHYLEKGVQVEVPPEGWSEIPDSLFIGVK